MKFLGKNTQPEKIDEMAEYVEQKEREVEEFLQKTCDNDETYGEAGVLSKTITTLAGDTEKYRKADKEPFMEAGRAVDSAYGELKTRLDKAKKRVITHAEPYAQELQRKEEERRRKFEDEAAEQRRLAREAEEEAARRAAEIRDSETARQFTGKDAEAQNRAALADKLENAAMKTKPISSGITGFKMRYVTKRSAVITDYTAALLYYGQNEKVSELIQSLANADARAGIKAAGCEIKEEKELRSA